MKRFLPVPASVKVGRMRLVGWVFFGILVIAAGVIGALGGLLIVYSTDLPEVGELERYRPSSVTEIYDDHGRVIGSFALQRRIVVAYNDIPPVLHDAIISIEDKDFEKHWGINLWRAVGAAYADIVSGSRGQGASTITMQLARNLFLSNERTWQRKVQEIMLSMQIERRFTKEQIFTMYCNQIYMGHGVYGFEAAAQFYFNKSARDLTLEEAALLAGIPKGYLVFSPIRNAKRAVERRNLIINSMLEDGKITAAQATLAKAMPLKLNLQSTTNYLAPYFVEEVRRYLEKTYGSDEVHQGGLRVYTTLNLEMQKAAQQGVLDGLAVYERRHGWKGNLPRVEEKEIAGFSHADWADPVAPGTYVHALVTSVANGVAQVRLGRYEAPLTAADMAWTKKSPAELKRGDIVYVRVVSLTKDNRARVALEQDSGAEGALLALDNATGDVKALVGGRSYYKSQFDRAIQALRQVGSSFKPYVYATAVEHGLDPDEIIMDAPTTFQTAGGPYTPGNYDGRYKGAIPIRLAVAESRNVPAVKVAERFTIQAVIETARKFGITSPLPAYLPVALGAAEVTLIEQVAAFTAFPNDGVRVTPRMIRKVTDYEGRVLEENFPEVRDVISVRSARIMVDLLQGVVNFGTATSAKALKHPVAGKTGTTNDFTDAWFVGFSPSITAGVWIGFDEKKTLGDKETGGLTALPIWISFMKVALQGRDGEKFQPPPPKEGASAGAQQASVPGQTKQQ